MNFFPLVSRTVHLLDTSVPKDIKTRKCVKKQADAQAVPCASASTVYMDEKQQSKRKSP